MNDAELRLALAIGWLVEKLARATDRTVVEVAAELFGYLDSVDSLRPHKR